MVQLKYGCLSLQLLLLLVTINSSFAQENQWIRLPKEAWPRIALTNQVWYKNGDRFVHPSFEYAGTGFTVSSKGKLYAVTAKHVLWIAKNKNTKSVEVNNDLERWIMQAKGSPADSVAIGQLLNEDSMEVLEGPTSTILERDVLVFTVKSITESIQPLQPGNTDVKKGQRVYVIGNPYSSATTVIHGAKIIDKLGLDILIEQPATATPAGLSGSPIVDDKGFVIGVFSSMSTAPVTGEPVIVATSMEYFEAIISQKADINRPKIDVGALLLQLAQEKGAAAAIDRHKKLTQKKGNYYKYNLRSANKNGILETGESLLKAGNTADAIKLLEYNVEINGAFYHNHNALGKGYLQAGQNEKALLCFKNSIQRFPEKENEAYQLIEKIESNTTDQK
jgi:tetratricopeptide (TPR) repeat protein